jgi:hypothetical protein
MLPPRYVQANPFDVEVFLQEAYFFGRPPFDNFPHCGQEGR